MATSETQYNGRVENDSPTLVERLAQRLGVSSSAQAVYGEPVERDGLTIIPVAKLRYGFGAGEGSSRSPEAGGGGGGGGSSVSPLGYIEIKGGQSQFRPIHDPSSFVPLVAVGGVMSWLVLGAVRRLLRSWSS